MAVRMGMCEGVVRGRQAAVFHFAAGFILLLKLDGGVVNLKVLA